LNRIYLILGWTGNFWKGWKLSKSEGFAKAERAVALPRPVCGFLFIFFSRR